MNYREMPIGVFDSGIGGLTVFKKIAKEFPGESLVYFGDTARVPYGSKSHSTVRKYSIQIANFLMTKNIKMLVIACNTASAHAFEILRKIYKIPVINVIEPGAKNAISRTQNGRIGIIGTTATIKSGIYPKTINKIDGKIKTYSQACPLLVPLVEEGWFDSHKKIVSAILDEYLRHFKTTGIDTLILGCTHYPLLSGIIAGRAGRGISLVSSAEATTREVREILAGHNLFSVSKRGSADGHYRFYVSDEPEKFIELSAKFIGSSEKFVPTKANTKKIDIEKY